MAIGELRYKLMLFGDDLWATVIDENAPIRNDKGIEMKEFLIKPSEDLIEAYPSRLNKEDIWIRTPEGNAVWVKFPTMLITDKNPSRKTAIVRVKCGYDGRDTPYTKEHEELLSQVRQFQVENNSLRIALVTSEEEKQSMVDDLKVKIEDFAEMNDILRKGERHGYFPEQMPPEEQQQ